MSRVLRVVAGMLYYGLASRLPDSHTPFGWIWMRIREVVVRPMLSDAGRRLDIGRAVFLGGGSAIVIGDDSGVGARSELHGPVRIGRHVMVSPEVMIHTRNHRFDDPDRPIGAQGYTEIRPVVIQDDVWIGARAIILPGVTVGRGAVVGAGSVVSKDVPDWAIVVGNPARVVRSRRDQRNGAP